MKVAFVVPTHQPEELHSMFIRSLPHLIPIREYLTICLTFNGPLWTKAAQTCALNEIQEFQGFSVRATQRPFHALPYMIGLRQAAADLMRDADLYLFGDQNLVFTNGTPMYRQSSGFRYLQAIQFMERNSDCAYVMCMGSLGGAAWGTKIKPTTVGMVATSRGLFVRNCYDGQLFPKDSLKIPGALGESVATYHALEWGGWKWGARQFNNPTRHKLHKFVANNAESPLHSLTSRRDGAERYIQNRYADPDWTHNSQRFPKGLNYGKGSP